MYAKTNHVASDSFKNDYSHKHCWAQKDVLHGDDQEQDLCSHTFRLTNRRQNRQLSG